MGTAYASSRIQLHGEAPVDSSTTANWNSGTGTSGEAGADLVSIGTASDRKKLNSLLVGIGNLTAGATITIKMFTNINDVENKIYPPPGQTFKVGTDPNGIWVVDGPVEIAGVLRVEVESDNAGDDGKAITYQYALEDM